MQAAWLTDIHLNFVSAAGVDAWLDRVARSDCDVILLSGDIAEAHDVCSYLTKIDEQLERPLYFVLGNHDFYRGSIRDVREQVVQLCERRSNLSFLTAAGVIQLTERVGLVGHDGWADGVLGDYERSYVMMNDYRLISELAFVDKRQRWPLLQQLGRETAEHFRQVLPAALERFEEVILVTHVPPWREACWHEGRISDDEWAPHFTCWAAGQAILEIIDDYPTRRLMVLCGHTHGAGRVDLRPNLRVLTGGSVYGNPAVCRVFDLDESWETWT